MPPGHLRQAVDGSSRTPTPAATCRPRPDLTRRPAAAPSVRRWRGRRPSAGAAPRHVRSAVPRARRRVAILRRPTEPGWPGTGAAARSCPSRCAGPRRRVRWQRRPVGESCSSTHTWSGPAALCTRAAVLTASPATMPSPVAPSVTATSPVTMPARSVRPGTPTSLPSAETPATRSRPARTARSASPSVCDRRTPHGHHRVADELLHERRRTARPRCERGRSSATGTHARLPGHATRTMG